jgi:hypothetical protein
VNGLEIEYGPELPAGELVRAVVLAVVGDGVRVVDHRDERFDLAKRWAKRRERELLPHVSAGTWEAVMTIYGPPGAELDELAIWKHVRAPVMAQRRALAAERARLAMEARRQSRRARDNRR